METKQFKAESKRLMEMMIHSIYTHKEIFLRELISNASDAIDKLYFKSLTDNGVGLSRDDFAIWIVADKDSRTLKIMDNGIGMTAEELEAHLGTIAESGSLKFKTENKLNDKQTETLIADLRNNSLSSINCKIPRAIDVRLYLLLRDGKMFIDET